MSDFDSDSDQIDDRKKDPTYTCKTTVVEVTDRSTRQGQTGANLAKTASKLSQVTVSTAATSSGIALGGKASVAKVVSVSSLANMVEPTSKELLVELRDIFKDVSSQNKKDNVLSLNDLPYFGINPSEDVKKWIIPLEESEHF